jgi:hypothetical protein
VEFVAKLINVIYIYTGADWRPKFWWDFLQGAPKKNKKIAAKTKLLSKKKKKKKG